MITFYEACRKYYEIEGKYYGGLRNAYDAGDKWVFNVNDDVDMANTCILKKNGKVVVFNAAEVTNEECERVFSCELDVPKEFKS